ncbi:uncharacterized protein LOC123550977 isoform X2 [Mercenaria mercenaria]|uniref:uncharacterized protein LOC123550977 isoform X2 n=1 Tax=Mercenaria mercenaria TaxID=6596 RepID=UPI00234EFBD1|nr:uncharacterized protein LOC123550977 isoform X2 [Mercenaria mercenaria]
MHNHVLVFFLLITIFGAAQCDLQKILERLAGPLGLKDSGQIKRGKDCVIDWSFEGKPVGFELKFEGICSDSCTKEKEIVYYSSRKGTIDHCLENLKNKIKKHEEL